jgi:hypothetical protein
MIVPRDVMAYNYDRILGHIGDLVSGDASREQAKLIDCPVCGRPLDITIVDEDEITLVCPADPAHLSWHGVYEELPAWIGQYRQLNTDGGGHVAR